MFFLKSFLGYIVSVGGGPFLFLSMSGCQLAAKLSLIENKREQIVPDVQGVSF